MSDRLQGLQTFDWICIGIYACVTIGIGWYFGRRQRLAKEYFVGRGNMNPVLIGISLFVTLLSTISYLSKPGEALGKGPVLMTGLLALPFAFCVVGYVLLPIYMRQRVTSAYELLESRLGLGIRLLGASMFIALRLVWMSLLVYAAAKAVTVMIDVDYWKFNLDQMTVQAGHFFDLQQGQELAGIFRVQGSDVWVANIPVLVLFTGFVAVIYTSVGGLQAVVVTNTLQFLSVTGWSTVGHHDDHIPDGRLQLVSDRMAPEVGYSTHYQFRSPHTPFCLRNTAHDGHMDRLYRRG